MPAFLCRNWRCLCLLISGLVLCAAPWAFSEGQRLPLPAGISYTNYHIANAPWSIHVVRVGRSNPLVEIQTMHSGGGVLGLSTLSSQVELFSPAIGVPLAAINGDFYQRDKAFAGEPRGLQILNGETIHSPLGGVSFWIDVMGQPHMGNVVSHFQVTWPDGKITPCGLNEERKSDGIVLYTPALGASTRTIGGRELILERVNNSPWLPLKIGRASIARVRQIHEAGNAPLNSETMVLSLGSATPKELLAIQTNAILKIAFDSSPSLRGAKAAIGGGPILVRNNKKQKLKALSQDSYEFSSMLERHPRSAIGWNKECFFLVEVDGRQKELSVGMTLEELAGFMMELGCEEAMNLDGGGSATLWFNGEVRNSPCDGYERDIANSLVVIKKKARESAPMIAPDLKAQMK